jgi:glycosidase
MLSWIRDAIFYHFYPLGTCGAPRANDFASAPEPRLNQLVDWIVHLRWLGINALYLGPVFESTSHGYDTVDYTQIDRRLGTNDTLAAVVKQMHAAGIRVILDGVFHHVGRDFWAFRDVQLHREASVYASWFVGVDFSRRSPYGDPFSYDAWEGHFNLVKLNLHNPEVRSYLLGVVQQWIKQFDIDGLRLDVAYAVDLSFQQELAQCCRQLRPDFCLIGEIIHGDYRRWANAETLDATTNYEVYKGLYSSHNDHNYFEIAYSLQRQFGPQGIYRGLPLYTFADNHDVDRVASVLHTGAHLYPLYALLFTIPGVPSIYYGSEWGIAGTKQGNDDAPLRPALRWPAMQQRLHPDLAEAIKRFSQVRHEQRALREGSYEQIHVASEQLAFLRRIEDEFVLVVANSATDPVELELSIAIANRTNLVDLLDQQGQVEVRDQRVRVQVPACWVCLFKGQG